MANAFVMLGLLPEPRAEQILASFRRELEAKGFRFGVLTGELSVHPGASGSPTRGRRPGTTSGIPLAVAVGPVPVPFGGMDLVLTGATLTWEGVTLRLRAVMPDPGEAHWRPVRGGPAFSWPRRSGSATGAAVRRGGQVRAVR